MSENGHELSQQAQKIRLHETDTAKSAVKNAMMIRRIVRKRWISAPRLMALFTPEDVPSSLLATIRANAVPTAVAPSIRAYDREFSPSCISATYAHFETVRVGDDPEMMII